MFASGHFARDEDAQVADAGVSQVDDSASGCAQGQVAGVDIADPVQCLLWRGNVVAIRAEHHHRHFNSFQVETGAFATRAAGQLVADEQVVDDHLQHLAG
ncbi:hypothetical protein D3C85_1054150 [compost metagenome]